MNILNSIRYRFFKYYFPYAKHFYYYGTKVYIPRHCHLVKEYYQRGGYETESVKLLQQVAREDSLIFDVGTNIGLISLALLSHCASCTVVAFEPSPHTIHLLSATMQESKYSDRWIIIPKAVGNQIGTLDFFTSSPEMSAFDGFRDTKRAGETRKISVPVTTIDAEWQEIGRPRVSVIKVDVEGAELDVLRGAIKCIDSEKPYILTEWSPYNLPAYNCDPKALWELANDIGYKMYSLPRLIPVNNSTDLEIQMLLTENFFLAPCNG